MAYPLSGLSEFPLLPLNVDTRASGSSKVLSKETMIVDTNQKLASTNFTVPS